MNSKETDKLQPSPVPESTSADQSESTRQDTAVTDIFADLEATLEEVADTNPRIEIDQEASAKRVADLKALLEISIGINSSLVLEDVFQMVMHKAIELMKAERGLIMLINESGQLETKVAYNLCKEEMMEEDFRISSSITSQVARTGRAVYTSDALADERYAKQKSIVELHLRSIMCVPLTVKGKVIGVIYLDNSNQATMFLKSDLYLFELYAQLVSNALHNARIYDSLLSWEEYHKSVVKNSPVGIIVLDDRGRLVTMNPTALEIFDLNRDDVVMVAQGRPPTEFLQILPESERPRWRTMMNTVTGTGEDFSDARYFHNTGYVEKALSIKISRLSGLPDGGDGLAMAVEDISEKVLMEKYVILSEKLVARGEMAASVAHELNNYLSIIANNSELMAINIDRDKLDAVKFNSKSIVENVFKMKRFVDSLMDFAQPETEYITYDLRHLIDDLLFSLRIQPRFKLIHFTVDLSEELPNAEIDVGQIQQVLMNLLNNAADAIEEEATRREEAGEEFERRISIAADYDESREEITVTVRDNGAGMSEETMQKIFNLHFSTKSGGHGLGLHNCRKIVEHHGGTLTPSSVPGDGSTFKLVLPRFQPTRE
jgi:PAS domain S-box-containing protein